MKRPRPALILALALALVTACKDKPDGKTKPTEEDYESMREECGRIMPKTYSGVWIGQPREEFEAERPDARHEPSRTDPMERRWYSETSPTGVHVWFGVDRETDRLAVVQFAHKFAAWDTFRAHSVALQDRFGTEYELYTCPGNPGQASMTRLFWPRQPVAVMEAVLEFEIDIAVTMIVARVQDLRRSIEKQKCVRVDRERALEMWIEEKIAEEVESMTPPPGHGHGHHPHGPIAPGIDPETLLRGTDDGEGAEDDEGPAHDDAPAGETDEAQSGGAGGEAQTGDEAP